MLEGIQLRERGLERDSQQEPRQDLGASLGHPQLLQNLIPVAVHPLVLGLVPTITGVGVCVGAQPRLT